MKKFLENVHLCPALGLTFLVCKWVFIYSSSRHGVQGHSRHRVESQACRFQFFSEGLVDAGLQSIVREEPQYVCVSRGQMYGWCLGELTSSSVKVMGPQACVCLNRPHSSSLQWN